MEPLFNQEIHDALRTSGALRHRHERMELRNRTRAASAAVANIHNDQAATTNSGENNPNSGTTQQPHRRESIRQSERNAAQQRINAAAAENQREEVFLD